MYDNAKNTANYLAKSETLPMFALRTGTIRTSNVHNVDAITALSLVHFYVRSRDQFAKLGGNASFCTYINRIFDDKCELVSRIRSRRKVRPSQTYSLRNRLHLLLLHPSTTGNAIGFRETSTEPNSPTCPKSTWSTSTDRFRAATLNLPATTFLPRSSMMKSIRRSLSAVRSSSSCPNIRERTSMTLRPISA